MVVENLALSWVEDGAGAGEDDSLSELSNTVRVASQRRLYFLSCWPLPSAHRTRDATVKFLCGILLGGTLQKTETKKENDH